MLSQICFSRASLHLDIAEIAYVAADVQSDGNNAHRLHPTIDICEADNLPRINSLLDLAFSEALHILSPLLSPLPSTTGNAPTQNERNTTQGRNRDSSTERSKNETGEAADGRRREATTERSKNETGEAAEGRRREATNERSKNETGEVAEGRRREATNERSKNETGEVAEGSSGMLCVTFREDAVSPVALLRIRETLHEYLIASVLYGWLSVSLPSAANHWKEKRESLRSVLGAIAPLLRTKRRRQSPF